MRKLFGNSEKQPSPRSLRGPELDKALARLTIEPPEATWAALVSIDGQLVSCFPPQPPTDGDRISAMSAATLALGERISKELRSGELHYSLIAGMDGINLIMVLNKGYLLALGLRRDLSLDETFEGLRLSLLPLLQLLEIVDLPI